MPSNRELLEVLAGMRGRLDADLSLGAVAELAGWSPFHLHRAFHRLVGETPKRYVQRLRLEHAAARLAACDEPVTDVALAAGFGSHEVFSRAFRRHFGRTPRAYRAAARHAPADARARHRAITESTGPCIGLFHMPVHTPRRPTMPTPSIERKTIEPCPILFIRRRVGRHEIATTIGQCLGAIFGHCQAAGIAVAGRPFTRYPEAGQGLITMETGLAVAAPAAGTGEIEAGTLHGGAVALAIHAGAYDSLGETYTAIERWIGEQGARPGGPPWEVYVTDPAEHPDPKDWRTEIYWPLAE